MATAFVPLANITLGASQSTVTFSSIPGTYRDLVLVMVPITSGSSLSGSMTFNGDTSSNYSGVYMYGNGANAYSGTYSTTYLNLSWYAASTAAAPAPFIHNIMDYSATDKHKSVLTRASGSANGVDVLAGRWASTAAITTVAVTGNSSFQAGSTFALYGISA